MPVSLFCSDNSGGADWATGGNESGGVHAFTSLCGRATISPN